MSNFGLSTTGLLLPRASDFIARAQARYEEETGERPDWARDLVVRSFMIAVADEFDALSEHVQAIYDMFDENNAAGVQLENLCAISPGISRKRATKSQVTLTLVGDPGSLIAIGSKAETDLGIVYVTTENATIGALSVVDVVADAELVGEVIVIAGQVTNITSPVEGWSQVTNVADASPGSSDEVDEALRIRRRLSMQIAGGRSAGALLANVLALPFITDAFVAENDRAVTATVDGESMPPNSVLTVVQPNPLTSEQAELVAQVIYGLVPMGILSTGTEVATVIGADGNYKTVSFSYPSDFNVSTQITYSVRPGFSGSAIEAEIEAVVNAYFAALGSSDTVERLKITSDVQQLVPGCKAFDITLQGLSSDVEINSTQVAVRTATGSTIAEV